MARTVRQPCERPLSPNVNGLAAVALLTATVRTEGEADGRVQRQRPRMPPPVRIERPDVELQLTCAVNPDADIETVEWRCHTTSNVLNGRHQTREFPSPSPNTVELP